MSREEAEAPEVLLFLGTTTALVIKKLPVWVTCPAHNHSPPAPVPGVVPVPPDPPPGSRCSLCGCRLGPLNFPGHWCGSRKGQVAQAQLVSTLPWAHQDPSLVVGLFVRVWFFTGMVDLLGGEGRAAGYCVSALSQNEN